MHELYTCIKCNYTTSYKKDYNKHLLTAKHKRLTMTDDKFPKKPETKYVCECGKEYKARNSLWYHKQKCTYILRNNTENEQENENSEIIYQKFAYNTLKKIQEHQKDIDNLLIMLTKKREECF
jgi:glycerophosphoryl diester phosphodiesterase